MPYRLEIVEIKEFTERDRTNPIKRVEDGEGNSRLVINYKNYINAEVRFIAVGNSGESRQAVSVTIEDDGRPNKEAQIRSACQGRLQSYANRRGVN